MSESIKRRLQALSISRDAMELRKLLNSTRTELVGLRTLINELRTDHDTMRTEVIAIGTTLADVKSKYEAHTHACPGSTYAASRCSTPDTGAADNGLTASAASTISDTSGSSVPAAISASAVSESLAE